MIKNYLPFALLVCMPIITFAQKKANSPRHQRWEIGMQAGVAQGQNDMNSFGKYENKLGGGLLVRYHLDQNIALRGNLVYAEISGNDQNYSSRIDRGFRFSAPVTEGSIVAEMDLLGKRRWANPEKFKRTVSPYFFIGAGLSLSKPSVDYNETNNVGIRDNILLDKAEVAQGEYNKIGVKNSHISVPVGFGIKIDLNENFVLGFETGLRVLFDDYMDGVSAAGNFKKNDTYSLSGLTISYRFPYTSDRDGDGVSDAEDMCPDSKGSAATKGCPDTDADGVADNMDACPEQKGAKIHNGCPDTDGDGLSDKSDQCPDEKGTIATGGCPDKDQDGIVDAKDSCPDVFGLSKLGGCPDSDNDGIKDTEDQCPNEAGLATNNGCPLNDRDRDGTKDAADQCPDQAGPADMGGCPDSDKDGVADNTDKCPTVAGSKVNMGCPELAVADKKVLEAAVYGVQFESAKSVLKSSSNAVLDEVAAVLQRYPAYQISISGHTDSDGSEASNQRLSEARAKACYDYLLAKGVSATRMQHNGFGESKPVVENTTKENKSKNRRVEFNVNL